jgi:hypothetical protein
MQPVAIGGESESRANGLNKPNPLPLIAASCEHNDGKEGVNGSSPLEGFRKFLLISSFRYRQGRRERVSASTERPPAGDFFLAEAPYCCC